MRRYSQDCPIARTLDIVGDRWTLLIVRDMFMGSSRFSEFRERSGIPPKVLSARLKLLMEEGMIEREVYNEHPLRAEYRLTERGRSLLPIILAIGKWGLENEFDDPRLRDAIAAVIHEKIPESREQLEEAGYVVRGARAN
jgi:DNA-binding HxlR family transcriptional regulator